MSNANRNIQHEEDILTLKNKHAVVARTPKGTIRVWSYPIGAKGKDHAAFRKTYKRIMTRRIKECQPDLEIL